MPKRIVDGDAIAKSKKVDNVQPLGYRAEYPYLLTLALSNGTFECDPRLIWINYYAFNRPDIVLDDVSGMLAEFERVDLLRRWEDRGKTWGWWVDNDKPGRLPPPSEVKAKHMKVGPAVPPAVRNRNREGDPKGDPVCSTGLGLGTGLGQGEGEGGGAAAPPLASLAPSPPRPEEKQTRRGTDPNRRARTFADGRAFPDGWDSFPDEEKRRLIAVHKDIASEDEP